MFTSWWYLYVLSFQIVINALKNLDANMHVHVTSFCKTFFFAKKYINLLPAIIIFLLLPFCPLGAHNSVFEPIRIPRVSWLRHRGLLLLQKLHRQRCRTTPAQAFRVPDSLIGVQNPREQSYWVQALTWIQVWLTNRGQPFTGNLSWPDDEPAAATTQ